MTSTLRHGLFTALALILLWVWPWPQACQAAPGLCIGPVCADQISRSNDHPWQLRLRLTDQRGRSARITVDCRDGVISPQLVAMEPGYSEALARKACRLS
ncbi:MAG: hypothetical protein RLZZ611_467 [Cyanobacteriota bacterium]|jgi:hypothetical protein